MTKVLCIRRSNVMADFIKGKAGASGDLGAKLQEKSKKMFWRDPGGLGYNKGRAEKLNGLPEIVAFSRTRTEFVFCRGRAAFKANCIGGDCTTTTAF